MMRASYAILPTRCLVQISRRSPSDTREYNNDTLIAAVKKANELVKNTPELAGASVMIEEFSTQGLRKRKIESSAVPCREDKLLLRPRCYVLRRTYRLASRTEHLTSWQQKSGETFRKLLVDGAQDSGGAHAYLNYGG
ncbi:hypothetical protein K491DRAFT_712971 [Lophiostoma macrostomum CBS 122681]|uniref:Uncharacterized protein n=1 Tax=Lophiostoma macrostomum CBS 122681 TaxID=1314788 RepID=A0A6A6TIF6_9PLEO|nr:hypothetical protein K491DRAFT_712971 [Lophiostoma macrostomum CBS 122681]